jgi:hypothetical protein
MRGFNRVQPVHKGMTGFGAKFETISRRIRARRTFSPAALIRIDVPGKKNSIANCENHALPALVKGFGFCFMWEQPLSVESVVFFRRFPGACSIWRVDCPRLAPWAGFFRRFGGWLV